MAAQAQWRPVAQTTMDPQNHTTAILVPRRSQSYPVFSHHNIDSHIQFQSSVYSLYSCPRYSDAMGADRPQRQVQPPRPPNAWILYRSDKIKQLPPPEPGAPRRAQADVSKMISRMWREESEAIKAEYEKRADVKKAEHQARYPHYRFQPMKKSEKDKLREQSKAEKEKEVKKSRRAAPYPSTAPHASSSSQAPAYFVAAPTPISYAIGFPPAPYSEQNAPSPPLSAASSAPSSPDPFPTLDLVPETSHPSVSLTISVNNHPERPHSMPSDFTARQASATSSTTVHTPSFSTFMLPPMAPSSQDASSLDGLQDWVTSAVQNWESQASTVSWPDILCHSEPDLGPSQDQRQPSELGELENLQAPTFVSLEMPLPQPSQPDIQDWSSDESSLDFMQAVLSATGDPSIFQVSFDPAMLTSQPPPDFGLSYAPVCDPSSSSSWLSGFEAPQNGYSNTGDNAAYNANQVTDISDEITPEQHEEMLQYLNFGCQSEHLSPANSVTSSSRSASYAMPVASPSTYIPPPGAVNTGRRVVAGSWKPSRILREESPPNSPVEPTTSQWGVRAVS